MSKCQVSCLFVFLLLVFTPFQYRNRNGKSMVPYALRRGTEFGLHYGLAPHLRMPHDDEIHRMLPIVCIIYIHIVHEKIFLV